MMDSKKTK